MMLEKYRINPCTNCTIKEGYGGEYRCSCCRYCRYIETQEENRTLHKKNEYLEKQVRHYKDLANQFRDEIKRMKKELS